MRRANSSQKVEYSPTVTMFSTPHSQETEDYISGRFG
ncbi:phosphate import ATP-binding protein pstB [Corynebacterium diphtheriae HC02]|nr:phosphate import ATP-binding protein pstB [Corynebacterium diphtheriae HC02]